MRLSPSNDKPYRSLSAPLLLLALTLVVYYPALQSGVHLVDDPGIIELYSASPSLAQVLKPGQGYYYRPLLELTFWLDNLLWGMEPRMMHLENLLLHCANTLLVFLLGRRILGLREGFPAVPFAAALLFALHPVNVEAVAWIAGRTDPLLTLLLLGSFLFWWRWLEDARRRDLAAALLLFGASLFAKETALAAGGVLLLTALFRPGRALRRQRATALAWLGAPASLLALFALFFHSGTNALGRFLSGGGVPSGHPLFDAGVALGFYARKLFLPLPLNFAITTAHPAHGLLALAVVPLLALLWVRRRDAAILFLSAVIMILPAVVVAVKQITWTPFAERYLYLSSAFCALGCAALIDPLSRMLRRRLLFFLVPVLVLFAFLSLQRTLLWQDKLAFVQDAIAKSPGFGSLYNTLGMVYLQREDPDMAVQAFATADRLNRRESMRLAIKANLLSAELARGNDQVVRTSFFALFKRKEEAPASFLELLYKADTRRLAVLSGPAKVALAGDLLETLDLLIQKRYDPFWLYRSGQLSLTLGNEAAAADFFSRAYKQAPADAHYREAARVYLGKMGRTP